MIALTTRTMIDAPICSSRIRWLAYGIVLVVKDNRSIIDLENAFDLLHEFRAELPKLLRSQEIMETKRANLPDGCGSPQGIEYRVDFLVAFSHQAVDRPISFRLGLRVI